MTEEEDISSCLFTIDETWSRYISYFDGSRFTILHYGHFETPARKTDILTFLENKRLFARTTYIRLLIYLKAIYGQKMKEIDFSTLAAQWSIFQTVALKYFFKKYYDNK